MLVKDFKWLRKSSNQLISTDGACAVLPCSFRFISDSSNRFLRTHLRTVFPKNVYDNLVKMEVFGVIKSNSFVNDTIHEQVKLA